VGELGSLRSPTLQFPVALKVWLGHLTETGDMRGRPDAPAAYVEDTIDIVDQRTRSDARWLYPGLVNRWSRRIWEATLEATAELITKLDAPEGAGSGEAAEKLSG
jgi:hypothetical protein